MEEKGDLTLNIYPNKDKNAYTSEKYTFKYDNETKIVDFYCERKMHQSYPELDSKIHIFGYIDSLKCEENSSLGKNILYKKGLIRPKSHLFVYSNMGKFLFSNEKERGIILDKSQKIKKTLTIDTLQNKKVYVIKAEKYLPKQTQENQNKEMINHLKILKDTLKDEKIKKEIKYELDKMENNTFKNSRVEAFIWVEMHTFKVLRSLQKSYEKNGEILFKDVYYTTKFVE